MRAPSMWTFSPSSCARSQISFNVAIGYTVPPAMLCVFSISISDVGALCWSEVADVLADVVPAQDAALAR